MHTAAASNLGQMLVKACLKDGVSLVNIVRKPEQKELLRSLGAEHVCSSASPTFEDDLAAALKETAATLAFDATGGGTLASQILNGMEHAANSSGAQYSRYGSTVHKQVYIYGGLDAAARRVPRLPQAGHRREIPRHASALTGVSLNPSKCGRRCRPRGGAQS